MKKISKSLNGFQTDGFYAITTCSKITMARFKNHSHFSSLKLSVVVQNPKDS